MRHKLNSIVTWVEFGSVNQVIKMMVVEFYFTISKRPRSMPMSSKARPLRCYYRHRFIPRSELCEASMILVTVSDDSGKPLTISTALGARPLFFHSDQSVPDEIVFV